MSESQNYTGCFLVASPYLTDGHFFRSVVFVVRHSQEGAFGVVLNRASSKRLSEVVDMSNPVWKAKPIKPPASNPLNSGNASTSAAANASSEQSPRDLIYVGGPVEGPLLVLHEIAGIGEPCGDLGTSDDLGADDDDAGHHPAGTKTTLHDHPAEPWGSMSIQWSEVPAWMTADEDHLKILWRREDSRLRFIVGYSGWGPGQLEAELDAGGWLVTKAEADSIFEAPEEIWEKLVHRCGHAILKDLRPDLSLPDEDAGFDPGLN